MIHKTLLGSTAIVAATLSAAASAQAGSVGSGDNLAVTLSGEVRTHIAFTDQDVSAGFGRGYTIRTDEAELVIEARNVADNGILYGIEIVLNVGTDDTTNANKGYMFIDDEKLGRIELGDQDDAIDRMFVGGEDALAGRAGFDGEVGDVIQFGDTWIGAANNQTGKATKATYFSPRIAGFQVGASFTPDTGQNGAETTGRDDDGDFERVVSVAANYVGQYDKLTVTLSIGAEFGEGEADTSSGANGQDNPGDVETFVVGGLIAFNGFTFGAGYGDLGDAGVTAAKQALGEDAGEWWDVGLKYASGPWAVSVGYYESTMENQAGVGDTKNTVLSFDGEYAIATGWTLAGSVNFADAENRDRTQGDDNEGTAVLIYNIFAF